MIETNISSYLLNLQFSNLELPITHYQLLNYSLRPFITIRIGVPKNPYSSRI